MRIPLEQTMCWDKTSQKNSVNTPVLMMAAIARLTGSNPETYSVRKQKVYEHLCQ